MDDCTRALITVKPRPFAVAYGEPVVVEASGTDGEGRPLRGDAIIAWAAERQGLSGRVATAFDRRGELVESVVLPETVGEGTVIFDVAAAGGRAAARCSIHPPLVAEELRQFSADLDFPRPCRIVFIGDSLTDFHRGANYVSLVERAVRARHGAEVAIINSGVGGDTIERIEARLEETVLAHRADWAFVFTGHNDSKIAWDPESGDFTDCFVPVDRFESSYRRVIERIRLSGVAKVTLVSVSASYEPTTRAVHEQSMAERKAHNFFGRPDLLRAYNVVIAGLAREYGLDYLDLHTPMEASREWSQFTDDSGVHLTEIGDRFVAGEILRYMVEADTAAIQP